MVRAVKCNWLLGTIYVCILATAFLNAAVSAKDVTPNYKTLSTQTKSTVTTPGGTKNFVAPSATDRILVRFKDSTTITRAATILSASGVKTVKRFKSVSNLHLVQVPKSQDITRVLSAYQKDPNVLYAEPDYVIEPYIVPNDPSLGQQWALQNTGTTGGIADADINAPEAWDYTQGSENVVVAVIDTGVDYTHEDLADNIWVNPNEIAGNNIDDDGNGYVDDIHGIDTVNNDSDPMDDVDHGTHVAGIIAAKGNNSLGVAGVGWNTKVIACKMISDSSLSLKGVVSDAIECLDYIYDLKVNHGINIIASNNSWGWVGTQSLALKDAISRQANAGILFVAAAGNYAADNNSLDAYPANYYLPNVISVAATTFSDDMAFFSDYGNRTVHVGAPGYDILSTIPGITTAPAQNPFISVFFNDVEGDQSQWQADAPWATTDTTAHGGTLSWTDSPAGPYENNADVSLTSPTIDLSGTGAQSVYLGFYAQYELEPAFDNLFVEVSGDNGVTWQIMDAISGTNSGWDFHYYVLPALTKTSQFKVRFHLQTDSSVTMNGISLDDIGIGVLAAGTDLSSNQYASFSGTSMASPHVVGLLALLKAYDAGRNWKQLKNLVISAGTPLSALQDVTISGRRIRAADTDGIGSLTCNNQTVTRRLMPARDLVEVITSSPVGLSVIHINCAQPAGNVSVNVVETGAHITLLDDGNGFDQVAGDGIYSAQMYVSDFGRDAITLQFPDNSEVVAAEFSDYKFSDTRYQWRDISSIQNKLDVSEGMLKSIDLPFFIPFANKSGKYNAVGISDGGYVILHNTNDTFINVFSTGNPLLPYTAYSNYYGFGAIVAPLWEDLLVTTNGGVYWAITGSAPNRELVVEWRNLTHFIYSGAVTFQAVFKENSSDIVFNYQDVVFDNAAADNGADATVGVQTTANNATTYSAFAPSLSDKQSILWQTTSGTPGKPGQSPKGNMKSSGGNFDWVTLAFLLWFGMMFYRRQRFSRRTIH